MKRRSLIAFVWFWGIWSAGSALDFLGVLPVWPFLVFGLGIAAVIMFPRAQRTHESVQRTPASEAR